MAPIKRVVIDILKPYEPTTVEFAQEIADLSGVKGVNATLIETDHQVQNLKLTVEGKSIDYEALRTKVEDLGGTVHSVDQIVCGEMVEEIETPQG